MPTIGLIVVAVIVVAIVAMKLYSNNGNKLETRACPVCEDENKYQTDDCQKCGANIADEHVREVMEAYGLGGKHADKMIAKNKAKRSQ